MNNECFPEMMEFIRENSSAPDNAFLERYCEIMNKQPGSVVPFGETSKRFTEIAHRSGYFESDLFFSHIQKMQPLLKNLCEQIEEGK